MEYTKFVGLDTHKETVAVAVAKEGGGEPDFLGTIPNTPEATERPVSLAGIERLLTDTKFGDILCMGIT